ncbi:hypothetical protein H2200_001744 [Cladophialophora chaetospira]|uniref:Zinc metallopeptidase n=1 Tax=Cladophialophora chaetospira TaxID=386627 RepID=A0AA39CNB4_9EURO|nr:hypothetical protein H2200_001744 [Cladophialophora chaetospira]
MSRTHGTELDPLVDQFQHLTSKPRAAEALHALKRIASVVKPIMRVRNWRVGTLAEFWPDEANLLGLNTNRGEIIHVRLRYPGDDSQFLPFENVVDTMLHELCHIVIGPHNSAFNALWDKLRDEHEALLRKGYTGEGFLGKGNRVGGRSIPRSELQRQARAAAERRGRNATLAQNSGTKLGGQGIARGQNAREIIAAAAERRNRVNKGCGSAAPDMSKKIAQEQAIKQEKISTTQAEKADEDEAALMQAYIDMIQEEDAQKFDPNYLPPSQENPEGGLKTSNGVHPPTDLRQLREEQLRLEQQLKNQAASNTTTKEHGSSSKPSLSKPKSKQTSTSATARSRLLNPAPAPSIPQKDPSEPPMLPHEEETWSCDICTLVNPINYLLCDACGTERPEWFNPPSPRPTTSQPTTSRTSLHPSSNSHPKVLASRNAVENIARFSATEKEKAQAKPVGWTCRCGNFMENQWWTCDGCGRMKESS